MTTTITFLPEIEDVNPKYTRQYSRAARNDGRWFEKHPQRSHRLRKPYPGELEYRKAAKWLPPHKDDPKGHPGYVAYMLVEQQQPGYRQRHIVYLLPKAPNDPVLAETIMHLQSTKKEGERYTRNETLLTHRMFENPGSA